MILRLIQCDVCGKDYTENAEGAGFPGWGALHGIVLDGIHNPSLCPKCLAEVACYVNKMRNK